MRSCQACVLLVAVWVATAEMSTAQESSGSSGSASCSVSPALGKVVCSEVPSGQPPDSQPVAAAARTETADVQSLQDEARRVSIAASDALKKLQAPDSKYAEDTSATEGAILRMVKQAADDLLAAAPDAAGPADSFAEKYGGESGDFCQQIADFRAHQLFHLWAEQQKYAAFTDGSMSQQQIRLDTVKLMDDGWWAGSTGAQVAIEIKGFTDALNDTLGLLAPEGTLVKGAIIHHAPEILANLTGINVLVTYVKENAEAAEKQTVIESYTSMGGQIGSGVKLLLDIREHAKNEQDAQDYRDQVQLQVKKIEATLKSLDEKTKAARENMNGYQDIVQAIDMYTAEHCAKKTPAPQLATVVDDTPQYTAEPKSSGFWSKFQTYSQVLAIGSQYFAQHPGVAPGVSSAIGPAFRKPVAPGSGVGCKDPGYVPGVSTVCH